MAPFLSTLLNTSSGQLVPFKILVKVIFSPIKITPYVAYNYNFKNKQKQTYYMKTYNGVLQKENK